MQKKHTMIDNSPSMIRQRYIEEATSMFRKHFKQNFWFVPENVRLKAAARRILNDMLKGDYREEHVEQRC